MKKHTLITLALAVLASNASASEQVNPWTDCGLGALIFPNHEAPAAISNVLWDFGTTAVTTQITSEDTCAGANVQAAIFIENNHDILLEQTSRGSGDHLTALLELFQLDNDIHNEVIAQVRSNISSTFESDKPSPEDYYNAVMASL